MVLPLLASGACLTCFCQQQMQTPNSGISSSICSYPFPLSNGACIDMLQYRVNAKWTFWGWHQISATWTPQYKQEAELNPVSWALVVPEKSKRWVALLMVTNEYCEEVTGGHFRFHVKETKHKLTFHKGQVKNWISWGCTEFLCSVLFTWGKKQEKNIVMSSLTDDLVWDKGKAHICKNAWNCK